MYGRDGGPLVLLPTTCSLGGWFKWGRRTALAGPPDYQIVYLHDYDLLASRTRLLLTAFLRLRRSRMDIDAQELATDSGHAAIVGRDEGLSATSTVSADPAEEGRRMHGLIEELYPICRSITGDGVRKTLDRIAAEIPLRVEEVPTGTEVFDWTVPREWNIRDAYVKNLAGERVIDFKRCNLHVLGYSVPVASASAGPSSTSTCSRSPSTPTGFPTAPPTTRRRGGSASANDSARPWTTPSTTSSSTHRSRTAR